VPVSSTVVSRLALANLVANGAIVVTGGAVRLTGSGLGCPTWPRCTDESFVATPELAGHGAIEFGNRLLTVVLAAVAIATVVAVFRSARRDLRGLAVASFLGIPAQALLGGVTVLTGLNPWTVAAHFLVSSGLVALTTVLWLRSREPGVGSLLVRRPFALLVTGTAAATAAVLVLGTVVTGSGPHSGDQFSVRTGFDPALVSHVHAAAVWVTIGATLGCVWLLRSRAAVVLLAVEVVQAAIGLSQYHLGLPVLLVGLHLLGAALSVAAVTNLALSVRS
jgi:heme a synthase